MICKHGYEEPFLLGPDQCRAPDQLDGATVTELHASSMFKISGRGTVLVVEQMANQRAIVGRTVDIDGKPYLIKGFESCLIPGHDKGHCFCFKGVGLLVGDV